MKIGVLSPWDLTDPHSRSGVIAPAISALSERVEVTPLQVPPVADSWVDRFLARARGLARMVYLPTDAFFTTLKK